MTQIGENSLVDFETSTRQRRRGAVWYRFPSVVLYDEESGQCAMSGVCWTRARRPAREPVSAQSRARRPRGLCNRAAALDRIETALRTESRRACSSSSMWTISRP
ncbi:MAG: hypothetical protein ACLTMP_08160 [Eggerthella lenta]